MLEFAEEVEARCLAQAMQTRGLSEKHEGQIMGVVVQGILTLKPKLSSIQASNYEEAGS